MNTHYFSKMNDICRLCLSVAPELINDLYNNSEIMQKISSCLRTDILKEDSLPNQICLTCNEKLDQMLTYLKTVINNQNILYHHLKLGKDYLVNFYSILKDGKKNYEENVGIKEELDENITDKIEFEVSVKPEDDLASTEEINDYSSDDNIALISLKGKEQLDCIQENPNKKNTEKDNKNISFKRKSSPTESKENIKQSISNSTKILEFKCLMCFKVLDTHSKLTEHYQNAHRPVKPLTSEKISYVEEDKDKYKCVKCEKISHTKRAARAHFYYKHQESRPYICNLCGRTYKFIPEIILHLRAHSGLKLFCSFGCGYNTAYAAGLRVHEKKHKDEYKFKCKECGKGFEVKSWFEEHQNIHTGAKPFVCKECGLAYHFKRYLVRHETRAHPTSSAAPDSTRFVCTQCALPCHTKIALKRHLSKEHGIKTHFLCDVCGKSFNSSSNLQAHKKCHLGVKSYSCSTCHKFFSSGSSLRRHELTHGEPRMHKRHECGECGKRYTHKAALAKHELRQHSAAMLKSE